MNASLAAFLFWISVAVCAVAELAIVAATARASRRAASSGEGVPLDVPQVDGARALPAPRRWLEILYAAVPAVILALLFVFTWRAMHPAPLSSGSAAEIERPAAPLPMLAGPLSE